MTEDFLYYIWQFRLLRGDLSTLAGHSIVVEHPGFLNTDAGPDFLHAKILVDEVLWCGNVEIHTKTSDWYFHGHDGDANYENLILHVVYHHDLDELPHDCPLLVIQDLIPNNIIENYNKLLKHNHFIPCENLFTMVDDFTKNTFVESLFVQRLQNKAQLLEQRLEMLNGHWEALLFERISYVFGLHVNAIPFELLTKSFSFSTLQSIQRKSENLEAFLFGQAGFLFNPKDAYQKELLMEYQFLQHKYNVEPIDNHLFKLLRLRPSNFPTIRIAQLANLYQHQRNFFSIVVHASSIKEFVNLFQDVQTSSYWEEHYSFGKTTSRKTNKKLSIERIRLLLINALIPIKFLYAKKQGSQEVEDLIEVVRGMEPESNSIIQNFEKIGAKIESAVDSQAYLELKKNFCESKKCLHCKIGNKIMNHVR